MVVVINKKSPLEHGFALLSLRACLDIFAKGDEVAPLPLTRRGRVRVLRGVSERDSVSIVDMSLEQLTVTLARILRFTKR